MYHNQCYNYIHTLAYLESIEFFVQRSYPQLIIHELVPVAQNLNPIELIHEDSFCSIWTIHVNVDNQLPVAKPSSSNEDKESPDPLSCQWCPKIIPPPTTTTLKPASSSSVIPSIEKKRKLVDVRSEDSDSDSSENSETDSSDNSETDSSEDPNEKWLRNFYACHDPSKLPHVPVILNRYQRMGNFDELKMKLKLKYGTTDMISQNKDEKKDMADEDVANPNQEADVKVGHHDAKKAKEQEEEDEQEEEGEGEDEPSDCYCYPEEKVHQVLVYVFQCHKINEPDEIIWVVDCPARNWVPVVFQDLKRSIRSCCSGHQPSLMIHFTSKLIFESTEYQEQLVNVACQHLVFDGQVFSRSTHRRIDGIQYRASYHQWNQLSTIAPHLFPRPIDSFTSRSKASSLEHRYSNILERLESKPVVLAIPKLQYCIYPPHGCAHPVNQWTRGWHWPNVERKVVMTSSTRIEDGLPTTSPLLTREEENDAPEVCFLGTGSAAPSPLRNATGIYVRPQGHRHAFNSGGLIDCGEGTWGQLQRAFGTGSRFKALLAGLSWIWISHKHADHQGGLISFLIMVLHARDARAPACQVVVPRHMMNYVKLMLAHEDQSKFHIRACDPSTTVEIPLWNVRQRLAITLESVRVYHCYEAFGLVLKLSHVSMTQDQKTRDWKIVYSGDTRPCKALMEAGQDADVLIHEATFESSRVEDAVKKKHCTVSEAIQVSKSMKAKHVILTHFSQRYPVFPPDQQEYTDITMAFDLLTVKLHPTWLTHLPATMQHLAQTLEQEKAEEVSGDSK